VLTQVLPLVLLIILGLAGLRGVLTVPQWNGPLHRDGPVISLALEVVLLVLLVITIRRRAAAQRAGLYAVATPGSMVEVKLRAVLIPVLGAGMIVVAVTTLLALHLHLFTNRPAKSRTFPSSKATPLPSTSVPGAKSAGSLHIPLAALLDTLLVVLLIAGVIVTATRRDPQVQVGASPRGGLALVQLARGQALLAKRDYVIPDDIKAVAVPALAHRVTLRPELWVRQVSSDDVVAKLLSAVPTPKTDPAARAGGRGQAPAVTG